MSTQPAPVPKYDLPPELSQKVIFHQARIPAAVKAAESIKVADDRTEQLAVNARRILKEKGTEAERDRTAEVAPHNLYVKHVNGLFKPLTDALDKAVTYIDGQLLAWRREKQRRIDEENRRIAAEVDRQRQEAEARAAEEAKAAGNFTPAETHEYAASAAQEVVAPVPLPPPPSIVRTDFAAAGTVSRLDFEIVDLAALAKAHPEALEVKRGVVLDLGRCMEKSGLVVPFEAEGVRFFRRDGISER